MSTIPDTMKIIAKDIQGVFEELVKLLLRKSLHPTLNPLGQNTKIVYNTIKGRYERGLIGSSPDDNINKYTYTMTNDSLGWSDEVLVNFKVMAKFIKSNSTQKFPTRLVKTHNALKTKTRVAFSDKETRQYIMTDRTSILTQYKNFVEFES